MARSDIESGGFDPTAIARAASSPGRQRRFYEKVTLVESPQGFALHLDGKPALTPGKKPLAMPRRPFAEAVAAEWSEQGSLILPVTMPVTRLANSAIDGVSARLSEVRAEIFAYAGSDLLYYRAGEPEGLVKRQRAAWDPLIARAERRYGVRFVLAEGMVYVAQPPTTMTALGAALARFDDPFRLAGLDLATTLTGSALIALALAEGEVDLDQAWAAAHVDEDWNVERWGADAEATERRASRLADFRAAALALLA